MSICRCIVWPAAELVAPGVVRHMYGNKFTLGEPDGSLSPRVIHVAKALEGGGFSAPIRRNIRDDIFKKLWGNATFNPISALTGSTLDLLLSRPGVRELIVNMMQEVQKVGEAYGVHFRITVQQRMRGAEEVR